MVSVEHSDLLPLRPTLAFADAGYEQSFVRHYQEFYYRYAQASLTVGLILIFADFLVDYIAFSNEPTNAYRVQVCMPILGVGIACSFAPFARRHWQFLMSALIAAVSCSLFWVLLIIDKEGGAGLKSWVGILNFTFLEFYCFVILGVQFRYAFASGSIILLMFEAAMLLQFGGDWRAFCYWSYHVVTLFVLAAGIGWWREYVLRKDFSAQTSLRTAKNILKNQNELLEIEVCKRTQKIRETQEATIVMLASLAETRDDETGNHIRRTQHYVRALARQLRSHPKFSDYLTEDQIDILFKSAALHDIGKVGVPDSILLKPANLDPREFGIMKTHTTLGHDAIENAEKELGITVDFLACAKEIALNHHEKWNGSGYPGKLKGSAIPISARLMAVADVYDALTSRRVYKDPIQHQEAVAIILDGRGKHFDPDVVDAFVEITDEFKDIADRFLDRRQQSGRWQKRAEEPLMALADGF